MKKIFFLLLILFPILLVVSCSSSDEDPMTQDPTEGDLYITSNPAGAEIWIEGANTNLTTPDTILNIGVGMRNVTLKLQDFNDTTFSVNIIGDEFNTVGPIGMVSNIYTTLFGPVRIYETAGTTANEPSGLDLSSGMAYGVSSPNADLVDIYYSSNGFLVQSADLYPGLVRVTKFFVSSGSNLFDGVDSPDKNTGSWTSGIKDTTRTNYVFLYDHDGHYSKLKIVDWGGGVPGEPAWVEVQWYYNTTTLDTRFK